VSLSEHFRYDGSVMGSLDLPHMLLVQFTFGIHDWIHCGTTAQLRGITLFTSTIPVYIIKTVSQAVLRSCNSQSSSSRPEDTAKMINAVLVFNNNGQPRLTKFYTQLVNSPPKPRFTLPI